MTSSGDPGFGQTLGGDTVFHSLSASRPVRSPVVPPPIVPPPIPHTDRDLVQDCSPPVDENGNAAVLSDLKKATEVAVSDTAANVSKSELAQILDGFAKVLKADAKYGSISFADHAAEVGQMKQLLVEAQETIITLLNDRVYDRAKLAKLEAENRLMPDLQAQANRAIRLANQSEEVQTELHQVRAEVERLRTAYMRSEEKSSGWLSRIFKI